MSELLHEHEGAVVYMDDILVFGETQEVLETIWASNLRLNKDKCQFSQPELKFFEQVVTKDSIAPIPERVKAITTTEPPQDVSELRWLLEMVNYIEWYLPNLSTRLMKFKPKCFQKTPSCCRCPV